MRSNRRTKGNVGGRPTWWRRVTLTHIHAHSSLRIDLKPYKRILVKYSKCKEEGSLRKFRKGKDRVPRKENEEEGRVPGWRKAPGRRRRSRGREGRRGVWRLPRRAAPLLLSAAREGRGQSP